MSNLIAKSKAKANQKGNINAEKTIGMSFIRGRNKFAVQYSPMAVPSIVVTTGSLGHPGTETSAGPYPPKLAASDLLPQPTFLASHVLPAQVEPRPLVLYIPPS